MKKLLMLLGFLTIIGCSTNKVDTFDEEYVFYAPPQQRVRVIYDVVEVKGVSRCESQYLGACDRNTDFYKVRKTERIDQFPTAHYCEATLMGCYY